MEFCHKIFSILNTALDCGKIRRLELMAMFNTLRTNVSETDAKELYPDKYMVLLVSTQNAEQEQWIGDLIFTGTSHERRLFLNQSICPENHTFLMVTGTQLEQYEFGSVQPVTPIKLEENEYAF
jgi:hypothetical protein